MSKKVKLQVAKKCTQCANDCKLETLPSGTIVCSKFKRVKKK